MNSQKQRNKINITIKSKKMAVVGETVLAQHEENTLEKCSFKQEDTARGRDTYWEKLNTRILKGIQSLLSDMEICEITNNIQLNRSFIRDYICSTMFIVRSLQYASFFCISWSPGQCRNTLPCQNVHFHTNSTCSTSRCKTSETFAGGDVWGVLYRNVFNELTPLL